MYDHSFTIKVGRYEVGKGLSYCTPKNPIVVAIEEQCGLSNDVYVSLTNEAFSVWKGKTYISYLKIEQKEHVKELCEAFRKGTLATLLPIDYTFKVSPYDSKLFAHYCTRLPKDFLNSLDEKEDKSTTVKVTDDRLCVSNKKKVNLQFNVESNKSIATVQ